MTLYVLLTLVAGFLYGETAKPYNPQDHIAANVDIYIELAPLEKINHYFKEFFFHLISKEPAQTQWNLLQQVMVTNTGVNFLNLEELKTYGFDIKKAIGLGLRKKDSNVDQKKKPQFSIVFPSYIPATLYRNILIRSDQRWEQYVVEKKLKTTLEVHELEKGKKAVIDPDEKIYLAKGNGFIVIANDLKLLNDSLEKPDKAIADKPGYKKLSTNYMRKLREQGGIISIFFNGHFLRSEAEKTDTTKADSVLEKIIAIAERFRADSNDILSVIHLTKNGLKYVSTSSIESNGPKTSPIQSIIQRDSYLSRIDRAKKDPYMYAKFQYNWVALFNYLEKLNLPFRPEVNKFLHGAIGHYAVANISSDFTTWIDSNLSLYISKIPDLSKGKPDQGWQGSVSFNFDTNKRDLLINYIHKLKTQANKVTNVSVTFRKHKGVDEWEFIETLKTSQNEEIKSDRKIASAINEKKTIVMVHSDEMIITFGRKKIPGVTSRPVIKRVGKIIDYKAVNSFLYINLKSVIESLEKGKSSFTRLPYWTYIHNIQQLRLYDYLEQGYINSVVEIKL